MSPIVPFNRPRRQPIRPLRALPRERARTWLSSTGSIRQQRLDRVVLGHPSRIRSLHRSWLLGPPLAALLAAAVLLLATALLPALAQPASVALDPEVATGRTEKPLVTASTEMVAAANPYAADAGFEILRAGGSAVDAAIATQLVLNLVEPQSSGIGGGAFLIEWNRRLHRLRSYDGREMAPAGVTAQLFLNPDGSPRRFGEAMFGGQSVGVPGVVRMLGLAHARHGRLPWRRLFTPAIRLAQDGFVVSPRLSALIAERGADRFSPAARAYLYDPNGKARAPGETLRNPDFAATLRLIAEHGPDAFYTGPIAEAIVRAVRESPVNPASLTIEDLAGYKPRERPVLCVAYRRDRVCGMGPPSSGGLVVAMTLKLLEPYDLGHDPMNPTAVHLISEAEQLAYADRDRWIADPDVVPVPGGLLDPIYLRRRRGLINTAAASPRMPPGVPPGAAGLRSGHDATKENAGTSHLSVVDRWGDAVAMTTSIEASFGSGLMAGGFMLNNELTDFSFLPRDADGTPIANAVAPGKRPRSSMAPTIVLDRRGRLTAVLGSPGGSQIPLFVVKCLVGLIDWGLDAEAAAALPNLGNRNGPLELERETSPELQARMTALGHVVRLSSMTSGVHIIVRRSDGTLQGGADPRREGVARGD